MTETTLHYIFDPLCGWCYGAAPLVKAAQSLPGLKIVPHAGGMMTGNNRRQITDEWRNYVIPHDKRIAEMTGQPFGEAYFNGLLRDTTAVMDSEPPITAILAAEKLAGRGLDMLHRIQQAHYQEGRRIADTPVLEALEHCPADNTSLAAWAARVYTTERTLSRRCQQDLGMSFSEWRQRLRFLHAVSLLEQGKTVQDVALDVGYSSASAFIVMFQQIAGTTPERFRRA